MVAVMLGLTVTMNNALYESTQQANTKSTLDAVSEIVYTDLNNAGGVNVPAGTAFTSASSTGFTIKADTVVSGGTVYTVQYWVTAVSLNGTTLYTLYRQENGGTPFVVGKNLTSLNFTYFNHDGGLISDPSSHLSDIDAVRMKVAAQIQYSDNADTRYGTLSLKLPTTMAETKVFPPNI